MLILIDNKTISKNVKAFLGHVFISVSAGEALISS
jgi:hypothetical protein